MKKVAIPVLAAIVACPAMAGQHHQESFWDTLNPYMGLRIGAGYTNHNYSFNGNDSIYRNVFIFNHFCGFINIVVLNSVSVYFILCYGII